MPHAFGVPERSPCDEQFSVSVETELRDVTEIAGENARFYEPLRKTVEEQGRLVNGQMVNPRRVRSSSLPSRGHFH
jgi:hypothetical protein